MRKIRKAPGNSLIIGEHPIGCKLCLKGSKMVLYVTGACGVGCSYCPIPESRQGIDDIFADERRVHSLEEIYDESQQIMAEGAGITGGDPLRVPERTIAYIKQLKQRFGKDYHLHLYTSGVFFQKEGIRWMKELYEAGLDEIRFHPKNIDNKHVWEIAKKALRYDWDVGFEVPCIPGKEQALIELIEFADKNGFKFVNLNEYEFTEANYDNLEIRGFVASPTNAAVKGSRETARYVMNHVQHTTSHVTIHFCTSGSKDSIQLTQRFRRRAKRIKRPYQEITADGLLLYGRVIFQTKDAYDDFLETLPDLFELDMKDFEGDPRALMVMLPWYVIEAIADDVRMIYQDHIHEMAIIEQFPTEEGIISRLDPL